MTRPGPAWTPPDRRWLIILALGITLAVLLWIGFRLTTGPNPEPSDSLPWLLVGVVGFALIAGGGVLAERDIRAGLWERLAERRKARGNFAGEARLRLRALSLIGRKHGPLSPLTLGALFRLATAHAAAGAFGTAFALFRAAAGLADAIRERAAYRAVIWFCAGDAAARMRLWSQSDAAFARARELAGNADGESSDTVRQLDERVAYFRQQKEAAGGAPAAQVAPDALGGAAAVLRALGLDRAADQVDADPAAESPGRGG